MGYIEKFYKKHKDSINSWTQTFLTFFLVDGGFYLTMLYDGDFSHVVLKGLAGVLVRSLIGTVLFKIYPDTFPIRKSKTSKLPPL